MFASMSPAACSAHQSIPLNEVGLENLLYKEIVQAEAY